MKLDDPTRVRVVDAGFVEVEVVDMEENFWRVKIIPELKGGSCINAAEATVGIIPFDVASEPEFLIVVVVITVLANVFVTP